METKVLLEDSWEAEDIVQYCNTHHIKCYVLSPEQITSLSKEEFMQYSFLLD